MCVQRFYDQCNRKIENKFPRIDGRCLGATRQQQTGGEGDGAAGAGRAWDRQCVLFFLLVVFSSLSRSLLVAHEKIIVKREIALIK